VSEFVEAENWPPNSADLHPVDLWSTPTACYRRRRTQDVEHLKEVLQTCWEQVGQDVIDRAIGQFQ